MRRIQTAYLAFLVVVLTAGPALAAPTRLFTAPTLAPPAQSHPLTWSALLKLGASFAALGSIARIKDYGTIAQKFVTRAGAASKDYSDGVAAAGPDWQSHSVAAETSWEQGTQQAVADKRYAKGIDGKSSKYVNNATKLGAQRYAPGVQNAQAAYQAGVSPFLDKLKSLASQLPPRGPRRSPQNQQRANMVATELGKLKVGH